MTPVVAAAVAAAAVALLLLLLLLLMLLLLLPEETETIQVLRWSNRERDSSHGRRERGALHPSGASVDKLCVRSDCCAAWCGIRRKGAS